VGERNQLAATSCRAQAIVNNDTMQSLAIRR
jgi:hypothetical protein